MQQEKEILDYFRILKENSLLGTSYIFVGEDFSIVTDILKLISCENSEKFCNTCWDCKKINEENHPDLFIISPGSLSIKIDDIREGMRFLSLKSFRARQKIMIIKNAQTLTPAAANAFLKTLEEPPKNSFIAVCSSNLGGLLPTIISRCRKIFLPYKAKEADTSMSKTALGFLQGENIEFKDRKKFSLFLNALIVRLYDKLRSECMEKGGQAARRVDTLETVLNIYGAHSNININLALNLIKLKL